MNELTPRDDIKKKVSEILKRVDRLIRAGEVDQAMREIIQAKEIDPKNVYIFAYEERITYLKEEHEKHQQQEQTKKAAEEAADRQMERRLMEEVANRAKVSFPDVMKEREVAERLQELLAELKKHDVTLEQYLDETDRRMEEVTAGFEQAAERDIRIGLALGEIAERESIKVDDEDVDAEMERMASERGVPKESVRAYVEKTEGMRDLRNRILQRKILDFLVHASNIKNVVVKGDTRK